MLVRHVARGLRLPVGPKVLGRGVAASGFVPRLGCSSPLLPQVNGWFARAEAGLYNCMLIMSCIVLDGLDPRSASAETIRRTAAKADAIVEVAI